MAQGRMQIETAVRSITVQVKRDAHDGELHHANGDRDVAPEAKSKNSMQKI